MNMRKWVNAIDGWTTSMRAASRRELTIELRRYQLTRLAEDRLHRSPWRVSTADLAEWLAGQPWAPETKRSYLFAIRTFYQWAKKNGHTKHDPSEKLDAIRIPRTQPHPVPMDHLEHALTSATDRDRLMLLLPAMAGLRRSEIAALRWSDIGTDRIRITGKGGHVRQVPIHPRLGAELLAERSRRLIGEFGTGYRYGQPDGPHVFPGRFGGHIEAKSVGRIAATILGEGWSAHSLRHLFATSHYAQNNDTLGLQKLLGHVSPETTTRYAEVDWSALVRGVNRL
jgi:integrase